MKTLIQCGNYSIGILDTRNYVVFDHTSPNRKTRKGVETVEFDYAYFSRLDQAVREVSRLAANEQADDLRDWLKKFAATVDELTGLFTAGERLLDLQGYSLVRKPQKTPAPPLPCLGPPVRGPASVQPLAMSAPAQKGV